MNIPKKQEVAVLKRFLMDNGVFVDDRIIKGLKEGVREIRTIEWRARQERKRKAYQKKQRR